MKFTGLILICATSCLALILPAIGVVQFLDDQKMNSNLNTPGFLTTASPNASTQNWNPIPARDVVSNFNIMRPANSLPVANPTSPFASIANANPRSTGQEVNASGNKLGMGVWLMLGPVCLVGLAMWTFAPNPSGTKPKLSKSY